MIVKSGRVDFEEIYAVINDGASAYRGIIPADRWHEPFMTTAELQAQIDDGVQFWIYEQDDEILGVMGIQYKNRVTLIRHAYVRTQDRGKGIGGKLLKHLCDLTTTPILIGTWADAKWAINFYQKHGFRLISGAEKNGLLRKYWKIPARQIETSVVLASEDWEGE
jgi:N-acetylglutamate synthase-like GNAT family acetyltransferase